MGFLFYSSIFIFGLAIGSFLNVVILRLETGEGIVKKRSHCPHCGRTLRWYDLIPILSFLFLRGRCRDCGRTISWQYPLVEISTGLIFLLISNFKFQISQFPDFLIFDCISLIFWFFIISCLIVIFVYDLRHYIIPDKIIFPAIAATILFRVFEIFNFGHWNLFRIWDLGFGIWQSFLFYLFSAVGAAAFFLAIVLVTRGRGMGVGDVKLAFLMGLLLGWPNILVALLLAFGSGALVGLGLIAAKQKTLKSQIPFGPFLIGGTLFAFFFGSAVLSWYFSFFL